jgi:hypothetical protein
MLIRPSKMLVIAFLLLVAGAVLPFLMIIDVLESTMFLNFTAYIVSVVGLFLGIIGIATYVGKARNNDDWTD